MSDQERPTYTFTFRAIQDYAPQASGVYIIFNARQWMHVGSSDDIRASLFDYLNALEASGSTASGPLSFSFEVVPPSERISRQRELASTLAPLAVSEA